MVEHTMVMEVGGTNLKIARAAAARAAAHGLRGTGQRRWHWQRLWRGPRRGQQQGREGSEDVKDTAVASGGGGHEGDGGSMGGGSEGGGGEGGGCEQDGSEGGGFL